jgi:hypothetical protein
MLPENNLELLGLLMTDLRIQKCEWPSVVKRFRHEGETQGYIHLNFNAGVFHRAQPWNEWTVTGCCTWREVHQALPIKYWKEKGNCIQEVLHYSIVMGQMPQTQVSFCLFVILTLMCMPHFSMLLYPSCSGFSVTPVGLGNRKSCSSR